MEELSQMELWPTENSETSIIQLLPSRARRSIGRGMSTENEHFLARMRRGNSKLSEHTEETCLSYQNLLEGELQSTTDRIS